MKNGDAGRDLLIALHAAPALDRAAACLLGQELERWAERPPRHAADVASELGLPRAQVRRALAAAGDARGLAAVERERAARLGARHLTRLDPDYPAALLHLALPPPVLCLRGALPAGVAVAIVGSRTAGDYGVAAAELFARSLAGAGVAIVSGFARGIDAAAHRGALAAVDCGALAAPCGRTVAVLGCGMGVDYPRGHARLGEEIAARGALVSEFPCGTAPRGWHFPVRNRIIAALAAGTLVVEAAPRSGSLVTVRHALDLGREVWAVPGRIFDPRAQGTNALIRDGAALVQHPRDVLETLGLQVGIEPAIQPAPRRREAPAPPAEPARDRPEGLAGTILERLAGEAGPEEIAAAAEASVDRVLSALLELELAGLVVRRPGPRFARAG